MPCLVNELNKNKREDHLVFFYCREFLFIFYTTLENKKKQKRNKKETKKTKRKFNYRILVTHFSYIKLKNLKYFLSTK